MAMEWLCFSLAGANSHGLWMVDHLALKMVPINNNRLAKITMWYLI